MTKRRIYLSPPHMGEAERKLLMEAFDSNWIAPLGPFVDRFEQEMCRMLPVHSAAALSSGTAALHLALLILGVERGDQVLCSTLTFAATANAILYVGAEPVFIDSDRKTWTIDPDLLLEVLRARARAGRLPKALIAVDLYGQCADYDRITEACDEFGVAIIEDAAEALGGQYRGRSAGTLGAIGILSFNGNKIITTAGGGMLLSDDPAYTQRARFLSTQAREAPFPHYEHRTVGYNYRLSNLLAAVGVGQLQYLQDRVASRRRIFNRYKQLLGGVPGIEFMPEAEYGVSNRWLTCVTVDPERFGATREDIRVFLESHNIESRPLWKPMHLQPAYQSWPIVGGTVASSLFEQGLCLPSGSALTDAEIDMIGSLIMTVAETRNVARSQ